MVCLRDEIYIFIKIINIHIILISIEHAIKIRLMPDVYLVFL